MTTVNITPIEWVRGLPNATTLSIQGNDNFKDTCQVQWFLKDANGNDVYNGWYKITGQEYTNWDGSNSYPLQAVIKFLNITAL